MTEAIRLTDFDYQLPVELIAQEALGKRDSSRLMTFDRSTGVIGEGLFSGITELLHPGDILVINDTRVIPARLHGVKESGGKVEIFLVRRSDGAGQLWDCLLRCSKPPKPGIKVILPEGMSATVLGRGDGECWRVAFEPDAIFPEWLENHGAVPLPPYIRRDPCDNDRSRYQTVFASKAGAVAAPTAGLHVTPELLAAIRSKGVAVKPITLHVGLGTFMPVRCEDLSEHRMHRESYQIPHETAELIRTTREQGGRVVALGTTVARALEQVANPDGTVQPGAGEADIFISPGYRFKVVDALITNFHLPMSTLLMLVAAFAGKDTLMDAYAEAVRRRFRFYSYGDAMYIY